MDPHQDISLAPWGITLGKLESMKSTNYHAYYQSASDLCDPQARRAVTAAGAQVLVRVPYVSHGAESESPRRRCRNQFWLSASSPPVEEEPREGVKGQGKEGMRIAAEVCQVHFES